MFMPFLVYERKKSEQRTNLNYSQKARSTGRLDETYDFWFRQQGSVMAHIWLIYGDSWCVWQKYAFREEMVGYQFFYGLEVEVEVEVMR